MNLSEDNKLIVSREYQLDIEKLLQPPNAFIRTNDGRILNLVHTPVHREKSIESEAFKICINDNETKWQLRVLTKNLKMYAWLKMIKLSSKDFSLKLTIYPLVQTNETFVKTYDGNGWKSVWVHVQNVSVTRTPEQSSMLKFRIDLTENVAKSHHSSSMLRDFLLKYEELLNSKTLSDCTIICSDGKQIPGHSVILSISSPVMKTMLEAPTRDRKLRMKDINGETMLEVLRFIYAGKVNGIEKLMDKLMYCADKLELIGLKKFCTMSMVEKLSVKNAIEYFNLGCHYNEKRLMKFASLMIKSNYDKLRNSEDWNQLDNTASIMLEIMYECDSKDIQVLKSTVVEESKSLNSTK